MNAEIVFTLKDGTEWRDGAKMIKHLNNQVANTSREISELLAHKNASEIGTEIAHMGEILFHRFVEQSKYLDEVMSKYRNYTLNIKSK
jgi:hypothetical protein